MIKRFFAFGCSYTRYAYMTWADIIGVNYEEYHNYGAPGSSNTFIMNRLVEVNNTCKFNSETDYVIVMLTGFGRFSYISGTPKWHHNGELHSYYHNTKDPVIKHFLDNMWSEDWAVYQSWIATKIIKDLLVIHNIPHKILMGIDNSPYTYRAGDLRQDSIDKANEIYNIIDIKLTIDEWRKLSPENNDSPYWENKKGRDGHPSSAAYLKFLKENLPEFVTDKSLNELTEYNRIFDNSSQNDQQSNFNNTFIKKFNSKTVSVFG
jgi:hypothetical protein